MVASVIADHGAMIDVEVGARANVISDEFSSSAKF